MIAIASSLEFYYFLGLVLVFSLCIGSFLNVVIYRLPIMLNRAWQDEARLILDQPEAPAQEKFNLATPNSSCPHCHSPIKPWQNIPVFSFIFLRGRCAHCQHSISWRYPLIELATGLLSVLAALQLGFNWQLLSFLVLTYACIALAMIDYDQQLLPDNIVLPLLWLGLLINTQGLWVSLHQAVFGAAFGYGFLWLVFWLFKLITGKDGMGYGDFKLMAVFGAWFGWAILPNIILLSSITGAVIGLLFIALGKHNKNQPIPFGPFIILAGWLSALYPDIFVLFGQ